MQAPNALNGKAFLPVRQVVPRAVDKPGAIMIARAVAGHPLKFKANHGIERAGLPSTHREAGVPAVAVIGPSQLA
jgi:hypothetical protein